MKTYFNLFLLILLGFGNFLRGDLPADFGGLDDFRKFAQIEKLGEEKSISSANILLEIARSEKEGDDIREHAAWELYDSYLNRDTVEEWVGGNFIDTTSLLEYLEANDKVAFRDYMNEFLFGFRTEKYELSIYEFDVLESNQDELKRMSLGECIELFEKALSSKDKPFKIGSVKVSRVGERRSLIVSGNYTDNNGDRRTVVYLGGNRLKWDEKL